MSTEQTVTERPEGITDADSAVSAVSAVDEWRIRVTGVVQGVGYRPFVYKLARELGLSGWVRNDPEGVLVEASGPVAALEEFAAGLSGRAPELARVDEVRPTRGLDRGTVPAGPFTIVHSEHTGARSALLPADTHVCGDCQAELRDPKDRRHRYPFINCTNCGPRYSIIQDLPYDRPMTTMATFTMCADCKAEYEDPMDRRYHAQPNACPDCGPRLLLRDREGNTAEGDEALLRAARVLADGGIAAMKSVGGFHLVVDATNADAVALLRSRKRRDSKPFAVMVRDLTTAQDLVELSEAEIDVLRSPPVPSCWPASARAPSRSPWPRATPTWGSCCPRHPTTTCCWTSPASKRSSPPAATSPATPSPTATKRRWNSSSRSRT